MREFRLSLILSFFLCAMASAQEKCHVEFADIEAAKLAIIDDPSYFNQLEPMEMSAKTGLAISGNSIQEMRDECKKRYQDSVRSFSDEEKNAIQQIVDSISPLIRNDYALYAEMPWCFIKVSDNIEGGLPHTRGKDIILSESMSKAVNTTFKKSGGKCPPGLADIFCHEQMHVFQRKHPGLMDSLYEKLWGFQKAKSIQTNQWLVERHLANPDAPECPWILPVGQDGAIKYLWPLVVFADGDSLKKMPADFRMLAVELEKTGDAFKVKTEADGKPVAKNLLQSQEFRKIFPLTTNIYHPDEASSDLFGKIIIFDYFTPNKNFADSKMMRIEKELSPIREWFRSKLGKSGNK